MSDWRRRAIECLPQQKLIIERAKEPMALWIDLRLACEEALSKNPIDEQVAAAIFAFARQCLTSPHPDMPTAVMLAFYEDIVTSEAGRANLHRWITDQEFRDLEQVFRYHLDDSEFDALAEAFHQRRLAYSKARLKG